MPQTFLKWFRRRHALKASDKLGALYSEYFEEFSADELKAIKLVRAALYRIAEEAGS